MKIKGNYLRRAVAVLAFLAVTASAGPAPRVVAIGDVHGAYPEFVSILQRTGLVDGNLDWAGGNATFVQTGDILDRGAQSRKALDLLMKLEAQAGQKQGTVVALLGNHEVMDMVGDLRYVSAAEYQAFATDQSEKVREQAFRTYQKFVSEHGTDSTVRKGEVDREKWMAEHPPGFFELRDAYGPKGEYGRWFRMHDAVAQVGDSIFLHGGLDPELHYRNIEEINKHVHSELSDFDSLWKSLSDEKAIWPYMTLNEAIRQVQAELSADQSGTGMLAPNAKADITKLISGLPHYVSMSPQGPLWYRGLAQQPEGPLGKKLGEMLVKLKVSHIVMGHTVVSRDGITTRFGGQVFLIDTGMLASYFQGRASALDIQDGRFKALYANGDEQVLLGSQDGQKASRSVPNAADGRLEP